MVLSPEMEAAHAEMMSAIKEEPDGKQSALDNLLGHPMFWQDEMRKLGRLPHRPDVEARLRAALVEAHDVGYRRWLEDLSGLRLVIGDHEVIRSGGNPYYSSATAILAGDYRIVPNIRVETASGSILVLHLGYLKQYKVQYKEGGPYSYLMPALVRGLAQVEVDGCKFDLCLLGMSTHGTAEHIRYVRLSPRTVSLIWRPIRHVYRQMSAYLKDLRSRKTEIAEEAFSSFPDSSKNTILLPFLEELRKRSVPLDDPEFVLSFMRAFTRLTKDSAESLRNIALANPQCFAALDVEKVQDLINLLSVKDVMES